MSCQQVQNELSLYLYGELDFAREEEVEQHLAECAFCQQASAREKAWHTTLNAEQNDVPLELISVCRGALKSGIARIKAAEARQTPLWRKWLSSLEHSRPVWSTRLATASFLVFLGFGAGRWAASYGVPGFMKPGAVEMGLVNPQTLVRSIEPQGGGQVRILIDQVREGEIVGRLDDGRIRQLLLTATRNSSDPAIRVDSVGFLNGQTGNDVRDALLFSVRHDANAAVRLKALEALRRFSGDAQTRQVLKDVLEHDDNSGVRSEAIDILAPAAPSGEVSPELIDTLQDVMRSEQTDDYVRMRCLQVLREINASPDGY